MRSAALCAAIVTLCCAPAGAQLAASFYTVTGIQKRVMPNSVQLTIRTDGAVLFGTDVAEILNIQPNNTQPKQVTSLRIRLLRARSRLPSFVDIGAYPVDGVSVTLGEDQLQEPFFGPGGWEQPEPRLDLIFRFYVPVRVMRFIPEQNARSSAGSGPEEGDDNSITFASYLGPRDLEVKMGADHRSVIITVISDRVDAGRAADIRRSPPEGRKHHLSVTPVGGGRARVAALHTPLADLLDAYSAVVPVPIVSRTDAAAVDVSLSLPAAAPADLLRALTVGYGLVAAERPAAEGGGYSVGRDGPASIVERIPLRHLAPADARLLFPDFLLPSMRADLENNALVVSGSPDLIARLRKDVARLDQPRPQVRVEAQAWELSSSDDLDYAVRATRTRGKETESLDTATGDVAFRISPDQTQQVSAAVQALAQRGRARLAASPWVLVASGAKGELFLGQQRYAIVLQGQWEQTVEALKLQVGYSLSVQPAVAPDGEITLDLVPRVSTVDEVERGTGLPTLGIREVQCATRVRDGDTVLVGILGTDSDDDTRSHLAGLHLPAARRRTASRSAMVVLVTARRQS